MGASDPDPIEGTIDNESRERAAAVAVLDTEGTRNDPRGHRRCIANCSGKLRPEDSRVIVVNRIW